MIVKLSFSIDPALQLETKLKSIAGAEAVEDSLVVESCDGLEIEGRELQAQSSNALERIRRNDFFMGMSPIGKIISFLPPSENAKKAKRKGANGPSNHSPFFSAAAFARSSASISFLNSSLASALAWAWISLISSSLSLDSRLEA